MSAEILHTFYLMHLQNLPTNYLTMYRGSTTQAEPRHIDSLEISSEQCHTSSTPCLICFQDSHLKYLGGSYTFVTTLEKRNRVEQAYPVSARRFKPQMMEKVMGGLFCLQNAQPQSNGRLGLSTTSPKPSWSIESVILRREEEQQHGTTSSLLLIWNNNLVQPTSKQANTKLCYRLINAQSRKPRHLQTHVPFKVVGEGR